MVNLNVSIRESRFLAMIIIKCRVCGSSGERFASHGDIFDCRGSSVLVDCIFVLVRI